MSIDKIVEETVILLNEETSLWGKDDRHAARRILRTALLKAKLEEVEGIIHPSDRPRSYGSFLSYADDRIDELRAQIKEDTDG